MGFFKTRGKRVSVIVWFVSVLVFPVFLFLGVGILLIDAVYGKRRA